MARSHLQKPVLAILVAVLTLVAAVAAFLVAQGYVWDGAGPHDRDGAPPAPDCYEVVRAADGFVSLRSQPTRTSAEIAELTLGTIVDCADVQGDAQGRGHPWRRCTDANGREGFISDYYLSRR